MDIAVEIDIEAWRQWWWNKLGKIWLERWSN